jgi:LysM repeat protein
MPQATYVVQQGDTYDSIAQSLQNLTSQLLEGANPNYPPANLQVGVSINIPINKANATYVVQQGDTLTDGHKWVKT